MSMIGNRYAKALLDLAVRGHSVDTYQNQLTEVSQIYQAENALRTFLLSPRNERATKKKLLVRVFDGKIRKSILYLLLLLLDKGRIESLPDVCSAYARLADEYRNILNITVTTALPLTQAQIDRIGERFKTVYHGSSVKMTVETDRSLIGGGKVAVGDRLYDGTVKGKLLKMKSALAEQ